MDCLHASRERDKFGQFLSMSRVVALDDIANEFHRILWHIRHGSHRLIKLGPALVQVDAMPARELVERNVAEAWADLMFAQDCRCVRWCGSTLADCSGALRHDGFCHRSWELPTVAIAKVSDASRLDSALGRDARIWNQRKIPLAPLPSLLSSS